MPAREPEMTRTATHALSLSRPLLIGLVILNLSYAICVALLLIGTFVIGDPLWNAIGFEMSSADHRLTVFGLRSVVMLGLIAAGFVHLILRRLLGIVDTVRAGDPFTPENARRLETIAWGVLALEGLRLAIHALAKATYSLPQPLQLGDGFSITPWLAVLLLFVLAGVFAHGSRLRADLDGTV
jgi:hypothetical protein